MYESISKTRHWCPRNMKCSCSRTMHAVSVGSFWFKNCKSSISVFACCRKGFFDLMILIATDSPRWLSYALTTCPKDPLPITVDTS